MKEIEKEILQEYIDSGKNKELAEAILRENKEARKYFDEISLMKNALSEMSLEQIDITEKVISRTSRKIFGWKLALGTIASLVIISTLIIKVVLPSLQQQELKTYQNTENDQRYTVGITKTQYNWELTIKEGTQEKLLEVLKQNGEIVTLEEKSEENSKNITYKVSEEGILKVEEEIKDIEISSVPPSIEGEEPVEINIVVSEE
jgi:hypothetical protein